MYRDLIIQLDLGLRENSWRAKVENSENSETQKPRRVAG